MRGGRRWEDFGVDGEREGKFGGSSENKNEKMGYCIGFCFEILKFLIF